MSKKGTLVINDIDSHTHDIKTVLEVSSTRLYELKVIAEKWVYDNKGNKLIIHWVWVSENIALMPEIIGDKAIIVGTIDKVPTLQISIIK